MPFLLLLNILQFWWVGSNIRLLHICLAQLAFLKTPAICVHEKIPKHADVNVSPEIRKIGGGKGVFWRTFMKIHPFRRAQKIHKSKIKVFLKDFKYFLTAVIFWDNLVAGCNRKRAVYLILYLSNYSWHISPVLRAEMELNQIEIQVIFFSRCYAKSKQPISKASRHRQGHKIHIASWFPHIYSITNFQRKLKVK